MFIRRLTVCKVLRGEKNCKKKDDDKNSTTLLKQTLQKNFPDHDKQLHWERSEAIKGATRALQRLHNGDD